MKLRYYMRGLGIGIVVTALLMGYSNKTQAVPEQAIVSEETASEETDNSSLTLREQNEALQQDADNEAIENVSVQQTVETSEVTPEEEVPASTIEQEEASELSAEDEEAEETNQMVHLKNGDKVIITVNTGEGSGTVARKLEKAGVIDNASEFDAYLMQHGYDKTISRGNHEVTVGSSWMDIAKQLTNK